MPETGVRIYAVQPGSLAQELDIKSGDYLVSINNRSVPRDILEYKEAISASHVVIELRDSAGLIRELEVTKDPHSELGLIFESSIFDGIKRCQNRCAFCFVHQLPKGLRRSLYVRDDDYRLSFLEGSFITLTNLEDADFERIISSKLSPLYVSVHSFDPKVRASLMGNPRAAGIMADLERLAAGGIQFHLQLVLVPGLNDGPLLEFSLKQLAKLGKSCLSLGVVPIGLTGHRQRLVTLRPFGSCEAKTVLETVHSWQARFWAERGERVVFAADEFYWLAGYSIPSGGAYEGFPQLENGIGLTRMLWDSFFAHYQPGVPRGKYFLVTGVSGARVLQKVVLGLSPLAQSRIRLVTVPNNLFGGAVTVTGLLGGNDIIRALEHWRKLGYTDEWTVIVPDIIFNRDGLTLDELTIQDIGKASGYRIKALDQYGTKLARLLSKPQKTQYMRWLNE